MSSLTNNHRFVLRRSWIGSGGCVNWIMLNPSTADEVFDDPTIRKCIGFSKRWGYSSLVVTNLFAFRATDPKELHALIAKGEYGRAVGLDNDDHIIEQSSTSDLVVAAWGANANRIRDRVDWCTNRVAGLHCIGLTKGGHPLHPCMAGYTDAPVPFKRSAPAPASPAPQ